MKSSRLPLFALVWLIFAAGADAVAVITPAQPGSNDVITAQIPVLTPCDNQAVTVVNGTTIRTTISVACFIDPVFLGGTLTETFGPLPPGIYTYEIYFLPDGISGPLLQSTQTIAVAAAAPVPAAGTWALLLMACALGAGGLVTLRP